MYEECIERVNETKTHIQKLNVQKRKQKQKSDWVVKEDGAKSEIGIRSGSKLLTKMKFDSTNNIILEWNKST